MPKITLSTQKLDDNFRKIMKHIMIDTPRDKLCKVLGVSESCLYKHIRQPELVKLGELRALRKTGRITDEQILAMVRYLEEVERRVCAEI